MQSFLGSPWPAVHFCTIHFKHPCITHTKELRLPRTIIKCHYAYTLICTYMCFFKDQMLSFFAVFEQYQKSRTQFVQTVAELATRPQNIEILQNAGVMSLLRPLLLDIVPTIQQTAALALGRLANYNDDLAEAVVNGDILPQLVYSLAEQNVSWLYFAQAEALKILQNIFWPTYDQKRVLWISDMMQFCYPLVPCNLLWLFVSYLTQPWRVKQCLNYLTYMLMDPSLSAADDWHFLIFLLQSRDSFFFWGGGVLSWAITITVQMCCHSVYIACQWNTPLYFRTTRTNTVPVFSLGGDTVISMHSLGPWHSSLHMVSWGIIVMVPQGTMYSIILQCACLHISQPLLFVTITEVLQEGSCICVACRGQALASAGSVCGGLWGPGCTGHLPGRVWSWSEGVCSLGSGLHC